MENNRTFTLNRSNAWVGGVCAGLADYLTIDILIVRIICAIGMMTWWPTIVVYVIAYLCLSDKKPSLKNSYSSFTNTRFARHFKNVDYKKRIYKSTRNKKIAGVCAGIAEYFEVSSFVVRLAALGSLFFGPLAFIAYIVGAVIMDKNPDMGAFDHGEPSRSHRKHHRHSHSHRDHFHSNGDGDKAWERRSANNSHFDKRDMRDCEKTFSQLEVKLRRLEAVITSKKFKLHSEMKNL